MTTHSPYLKGDKGVFSFGNSDDAALKLTPTELLSSVDLPSPSSTTILISLTRIFVVFIFLKGTHLIMIGREKIKRQAAFC